MIDTPPPPPPTSSNERAIYGSLFWLSVGFIGLYSSSVCVCVCVQSQLHWIVCVEWTNEKKMYHIWMRVQLIKDYQTHTHTHTHIYIQAQSLNKKNLTGNADDDFKLFTWCFFHCFLPHSLSTNTLLRNFIFIFSSVHHIYQGKICF